MAAAWVMFFMRKSSSYFRVLVEAILREMAVIELKGVTRMPEAGGRVEFSIANICRFPASDID